MSAEIVGHAKQKKMMTNREAVGWRMGKYNDKTLTPRALDIAVTSQKPAPGPMHHSVRGSTYTALDYREPLKASKMVCSISRKGFVSITAPISPTPCPVSVTPDSSSSYMAGIFS